MDITRLLLSSFWVIISLSPLWGQKAQKKIPVLNIGTFHMRVTPDQHAVNFDTEDQQLLDATQGISEMIARFKPTIICVEIEPKQNEDLNLSYQKFLKSGSHSFELGEVSLLAFEIGKLSGVDSIYGINHLMPYDHLIDEKITNTLDPKLYSTYTNNPLSSAPGAVARLNQMNTLEKLQSINNPEFMDFLINENADILTHVGTTDQFEGADEAARFYQRNLRMYSNLNRIKVGEGDRILILMGGTHTAFFNQFLSRSPKYELVGSHAFLH